MIRPLRDYMLVRPLDLPPAGLIQVVKLSDKWARGEVVAIGPKVTWGTKVGDVIQFTDVCKYPRFQHEGVEYLILQEADVCGIEDHSDEVAAA